MNTKDIEGLPDVDLSGVLKDLQDNQEKAPQQQQQQADEKLDLGQFKNPKDMLKSYKEIQAAFTRVTQENKAYKEQMSQLQEQIELAKLGAMQAPQQMPMQQQGDPQQYFQQNEDIEQRIMRQVATQRIAEVLEEEAEKNKAEFQERYAYAQMISREYPNLATTSRGVKKLFELGDKLRQENLRKNAGKALESIFGEPLNEEEITKLRTMVKGDKAIKQRTDQTNAYMPDTSTSTKSGSDQSQRPNAEFKIKESVQKGDVDGVLSAIFEDIVTAE